METFGCWREVNLLIDIFPGNPASMDGEIHLVNVSTKQEVVLLLVFLVPENDG